MPLETEMQSKPSDASMRSGSRVQQMNPFGYRWKMLPLRLSGHRGGRVLLHLTALVCSRKHLRWHLQCILRDFRPHKRDRSNHGDPTNADDS